jgi:EAL domain-containing protein (putative c-di-GMP-specific phosphodiesterase class I)
MRRLKALGVGLVIDDFGTGQSSLAHLKRFPVEKLKIDRSFVMGVARDRDSAAICRAVLGMGRSLGLLLVAEGVENADDLAFVRDQGFDYAQGYYYCKALPVAALRDWVMARQGEQSA